MHGMNGRGFRVKKPRLSEEGGKRLGEAGSGGGDAVGPGQRRSWFLQRREPPSETAMALTFYAGLLLLGSELRRGGGKKGEGKGRAFFALKTAG